MESTSTEALDSNSVVRYYGDRALHLTYRQLRDWERAGVIRSSRIGVRKKVFAPAEVRWAGVACHLRLAGWGLSAIKETRLAVMPPEAGAGVKLDLKTRQQRLAELMSVLEKQRKTATTLIDVIHDVIFRTAKGVAVYQYKRPKQEAEFGELDAGVQVEMYRKQVTRNAFKMFRAMHGLSQQELAKKLGFSQSRLSQIENGWIKLDEREKNRIAHVLNERVSVLFPVFGD